jgi:hypothetical protein
LKGWLLPKASRSAFPEARVRTVIFRKRANFPVPPIYHEFSVGARRDVYKFCPGVGNTLFHPFLVILCKCLSPTQHNVVDLLLIEVPKRQVTSTVRLKL